MLLRAHKVLMGCSLLFCLAFAALQLRSYALERGTAEVVRAGLALLAGAAIARYLLVLMRNPESVLPDKPAQGVEGDEQETTDTPPFV